MRLCNKRKINVQLLVFLLLLLSLKLGPQLPSVQQKPHNSDAYKFVCNFRFKESKDLEGMLD